MCAVYFVYANATRIHATLCVVSRVEESLNIFESSALNIYLQRRLSIYLMNTQKKHKPHSLLYYNISIEWTKKRDKKLEGEEERTRSEGTTRARKNASDVNVLISFIRLHSYSNYANEALFVLVVVFLNYNLFMRFSIAYTFQFARMVSSMHPFILISLIDNSSPFVRSELLLCQSWEGCVHDKRKLKLSTSIKSESIVEMEMGNFPE